MFGRRFVYLLASFEGRVSKGFTGRAGDCTSCSCLSRFGSVRANGWKLVKREFVTLKMNYRILF